MSKLSCTRGNNTKKQSKKQKRKLFGCFLTKDRKSNYDKETSGKKVDSSMSANRTFGLGELPSLNSQLETKSSQQCAKKTKGSNDDTNVQQKPTKVTFIDEDQSVLLRQKSMNSKQGRSTNFKEACGNDDYEGQSTPIFENISNLEPVDSDEETGNVDHDGFQQSLE